MKTSNSHLDRLFNPKTVALIGASGMPGKIGSTTLFCMTAGGYTGKIYPVNPKEKEILGLTTYDKVSNIPEKVDVAIICVTAPLVPQVVEECAQAGVEYGVIISAGFGEVDQKGIDVQKNIVALAREKGMRLVGPNCMGIGSSSCRLFATINFTIPLPGNVSIVSQSGTLATVFALGGSAEGVGFSKYVSSGNEADLHTEDFIKYYAHDPDTHAVVAFIEGVRDGDEFFKAARELTKNKPFVVLKGGASEAGAKAANSHTGSLAGSYKVFDSMCTQTGIVNVPGAKEAIDVVKGFSLLPLPKGRKVAVVSAQGGLGVLMADACIRHGLELATLTKQSCDDLDAFLPYFWSHSNPVDVTGGTTDLRDITRSLEVLLRQDDIDSTICLAPTFSSLFEPIASRLTDEARKTFETMAVWVIDETEKAFARDLIELREKYNKPIVGVSLLTCHESEMVKMLEGNGVPIYDTPDQIAYVLSKLADYREYRDNNGHSV